MAWIEVHQSLMTHRKTLMAADVLDLPEVYVAGHLVALWSWALDNAKDGKLPASARLVAKASHWTGDPSAYIDALCEAGFLDRHEDGSLNIHDFDSYAGRLIDKREANAERMRAARAANSAKREQERAANVHNTCVARAGATVPSPSPSPSHNQPARAETVCVEELTPEDMGARLEDEEPKEYQRFCTVYPNVSNRAGACREWKSLKPTAKVMAEMNRSIREWKAAGVTYWPDAKNWLKDRRWHDPPPTGQGNGSASNGTVTQGSTYVVDPNKTHPAVLEAMQRKQMFDALEREKSP